MVNQDTVLSVKKYFQVEARWTEVGFDNYGKLPWRFMGEFKTLKGAEAFRESLMNMKRNIKVVQDFEARVVEVKTIRKEIPITTGQISFPEDCFPPAQKFVSGLSSI